MVKPASASGACRGAIAAWVSLLATPAHAAVPMLGGTDWAAPLDHYCERVGLGFWAEPLNAFSNAAFFIAAAVILDRQRRSSWADGPVIALSGLAATVGVGSFLFHTFANRWSLLADILPIALFIYAFFFLAVRRFLGFGALAASLATVVLLIASPWIGSLLQPVLGGSATYTPGLIATFGVAVAVPAFGRGSAPPLLMAAGTAFMIALAFRILDHELCELLPIGTHFLWHTFNGVAIAFALLAAEQVGPARPRDQRSQFSRISSVH